MPCYIVFTSSRNLKGFFWLTTQIIGVYILTFCVQGSFSNTKMASDHFLQLRWSPIKNFVTHQSFVLPQKEWFATQPQEPLIVSPYC